MAQIDYENHLFSEDVIIVSKDDGTKQHRFTDKAEAEAYYEDLKREEVQDSIARNQAAAVAQNKEIIANQQRLIEAQERNSRMPQRPPGPQVTRQILDPVFKEWLIFQQNTPEYKKWKREQEAAEARRQAERAAEEERLRAKREEEERQRREKELEEQKKREKALLEAQQKIAPLEEKYLAGEKLPWKQRKEIALVTGNPNIIKKLQYDHSQKVIDALLSNTAIPVNVRQKLNQKKYSVSTKSYSQSSTSNNSKESNDNGCWGTLLKIIVVVILIVAAVNIIASLF